MHMLHMKKPIKILDHLMFLKVSKYEGCNSKLIKKFIDNKVVKITKGNQTREFNYVGNT